MTTFKTALTDLIRVYLRAGTARAEIMAVMETRYLLMANAMRDETTWQLFEPIYPRVLDDGSWSGWLMSETIMRRRVNGRWVYRRMNEDEATEAASLKRDEQTW